LKDVEERMKTQRDTQPLKKGRSTRKVDEVAEERLQVFGRGHSASKKEVEGRGIN